MSLTLWLLVYLLLLYAIGRLYEVTLGWKTVTWIFYPGMLVAALGRLLACLCGQQERSQVDLMRGCGPSGKQNLPGGYGFRCIYAVGPFVATVLAFVLIDSFLHPSIGFDQRLPRMGFGAAAVEQSADTLANFLQSMLHIFGRQQLGDWHWWAFLYLGFTLIVAPAPHKNDLVSVAVICAIVGLSSFVLQQVGVVVVADRIYGGTFWRAFSVLVAMATAVLLISALFLLPLMLLRRSNKDS